MAIKKFTISPVQRIEVTQSGVGQRLDNYLLRICKGVPRSHVYRLIRDGQIRVNGSRSRVHRKLINGDIIRLPPIRKAEEGSLVLTEQLLNRRERTLYEDDSLLIIDKPSGIAVHGGSGLRGGIIEGLRSENSPDSYLELVHRLDRETSGCLMLAKDPGVLRALHKSFRNPTSKSSEIQKKYLSLLVGDWTHGSRNIDLNLETVRPTNTSKRSVVTENGRQAKSRFVPIHRFKKYVLVEVELRTGRMHQIRAHAAAIGFPVGGDRKYGSRDDNRKLRQVGLNRLFLHATELIFKHPQSGQRLSIKAPMPDDLSEVLAKLS